MLLTNRRLTVVFALVLLFAVPSIVNAQRRGGCGGGDRTPGDVELEKGPLAVDDFERHALAVLDEIEATQPFRNVPQHQSPHGGPAFHGSHYDQPEPGNRRAGRYVDLAQKEVNAFPVTSPPSLVARALQT